MAVTPEQFGSIKQWKDFYFRTAEGRERLGDLLRGLGLFAPVDDEMKSALTADPAAGGRIFAGLELLAELGIWRTDMFASLIEAMAAMPMPRIEDQVQGETKG